MSIICKDGGTRIVGSAVDTIVDFVNVITAVRSSFNDRFDPETTDKVIALCGQLAYAISDCDKEQEDSVQKAIAEVLSNG